MSASDYTTLRRYRNMQQLTCNTIPNCHNSSGSEVTLSSAGYCNVPTRCVSNDGRVVSADLIYCPDTAFTNQKYITKTLNPSFVVPVKNATIGFLVEKRLPFTKKQLISCSIDGEESNYFNGVVIDYDPDTGFLSIGEIDNITGDFSKNVIYNINLILFDPETAKLKERMDYLYKYLFQINLDLTPDYNPAREQLIFFDKMVINLMYYLFEIDIRLNTDYVFSEVYLFDVVANTIYVSLFDVDITQVLNFQPNGNPEVPLTNLKNILYQIYIYLFDVNLEQSIWFNPN
jgi:hypothetical protein